MKIKYLGTGAAEGIPALFCRCAICNEARKEEEENSGDVHRQSLMIKYWWIFRQTVIFIFSITTWIFQSSPIC